MDEFLPPKQIEYRTAGNMSWHCEPSGRGAGAQGTGVSQK